MPKHLCKVTKHGEQLRLTIPKLLVTALSWEDVKVVILEPGIEGEIILRRFVDGESLKSPTSATTNGPD